MRLSEALFRLSFTGYGLACAFGAVMGLALSLPGTLRMKRDWAGWVRFAVCVLFFGWLGARVMFAAPDLLMGFLNEQGLIQEHNSVYLNQIGSAVPALYFWEGGYSLVGAMLGAILGAKLAEKWTGEESGFWRDRLALVLPAFVLVERLAEQGSSLGTGVEVSAQWLIRTGLCPEEDGVFFHPLYLYEALLAAVVLAVMAWLEIRRAGKAAGGDRLRFCLTIFCLPMIVIESLRPLTGHMILHFVNVTQVVLMILALSVVIRWSVRLGRNRRDVRHPALALAVCWVVVIAAIGAAVYCIFGMEKDWVSRGLAYGVIALAMAAMAAVAAVLYRLSGPKGGLPDGARED